MCDEQRAMGSGNGQWATSNGRWAMGNWQGPRGYSSKCCGRLPARQLCVNVRISRFERCGVMPVHTGWWEGGCDNVSDIHT
eukprot:360381-Chlamydomonas_euryale.AAC.2